MNKKSEKYQFNVIDFIIIIAIVATVVFSVNLLVSDIFNGNTVNVEYTLEIKNVRNEDINKLKTGDRIYSGADGNSVGVIKDIKIISSEDIIFNRTSDRFITSVNSDFSTLIITLNVDCTFKNNLYSVGKTTVSTNTFPDLSIPFEYSECEITNVYTVKNAEDK